MATSTSTSRLNDLNRSLQLGQLFITPKASQTNLIATEPGGQSRQIKADIVKDLTIAGQTINLLQVAPISWWTKKQSPSLFRAVSEGLLEVVFPGAAFINDNPTPPVDENSCCLTSSIVPSSVSYDPNGNSIGTSEQTARADHVHALPEQTILDITYAASVEIDFNPALSPKRMVTLAGDIEFTTDNLALGRNVNVTVFGDGSIRNLTFPVGWRWLNAASAPPTLAANAVAVLSLQSYGTANANVLAVWAVTL